MAYTFNPLSGQFDFYLPAPNLSGYTLLTDTTHFLRLDGTNKLSVDVLHTNSYDLTIPATGTVALMSYVNQGKFTAQATSNVAPMATQRYASASITTPDFQFLTAAGGENAHIIADGTKSNLFFGSSSGNSVSNGQANTAYGQEALKNVSSGTGNLGFGYSALNSLSTQTQNTAVGNQTMQTATGNYQVAFGAQALYRSSGSYGIYLGYQAGYYQPSGDNNVAIGYQSGYFGNGSSCLFLGYKAGYNQTSNNMFVVANGPGNTIGANQLMLGDFSNKRLGLFADTIVGRLNNAGAEKVTDGDFSSDAGQWTKGANWTIDTGNYWAMHTAGSTAALQQNISAVATETYLLIFDIGGATAGTLTPQIGGVNGDVVNMEGKSSGNFLQSLYQIITATGTGNLIFTPSSTFNGYITNVSVKRIQAGALTVAGGLNLYRTNLVTDTVTGTKLGTATTQKFSFWNKTPIVQPTTAIAGATLVSNGGTTLTSTDTMGGYTLQQVVQALINTGILA
jgi:hypothetical protein